MDASAPSPIVPDDEATLGSSLTAEGFADFASTTRSPRTGIRALVDSAVVMHERLPMLDVVLDRFVRNLTPSMRNFTSDNIEITIERVTSRRFSDFMSGLSAPTLLSVVHVPQWDNYGLLTVDSHLSYAIVDALLGGRRYGKAAQGKARVLTQIEQALINDMLALVVKDLSAAFEPIAQVDFHISRTETNPLFAAIVQPSNNCAVAEISMKMDEHSGTLSILLPYATIEPVREILLQRFMGEKFGQDSIWEQHLGKEIRRTKIPVNAVLGERQMRLGEVMNFKVGQVLAFSIGENDPIDLRAGGVQLARGTMGRIGKNKAILVTETEGSKKSL